MLGRGVMIQSLKMNNTSYPFLKVVDKLKNADIVFGNLENPIITSCPFSNSGFKFCADPKMIEGLKFANIGIVNLANNHILNYGRAGELETEKILTENGIKYVGDGNLETIENNGIKFGFLGFDFVDDSPKESDYKLVNESKNKVDVLIVMIHWGIEYTDSSTDSQKMIASELINEGADVVSGGHPHWVQNIDSINGKPVFYSLGNFVFDQPWSEATKNGLVIDLTYTGKRLTSTEKLPIYMKNFAQPSWKIK